MRRWWRESVSERKRARETKREKKREEKHEWSFLCRGHFVVIIMFFGDFSTGRRQHLLKQLHQEMPL